MEGPGWPLFWQALNFTILLAVLYRFARKPVKEFFLRRTESIREEAERMQRIEGETKKEHKKYEERLANLESEIKEIFKELEKEGLVQRERIIEEAKKEAERIWEQAKRRASWETQTAIRELRREMAELSTALAEEVIKRSVTPKDQQRLVKEYISRFERLQ